MKMVIAAERPIGPLPVLGFQIGARLRGDKDVHL